MLAECEMMVSQVFKNTDKKFDQNSYHDHARWGGGARDAGGGELGLGELDGLGVDGVRLHEHEGLVLDRGDGSRDPCGGGGTRGEGE